MDVTEAITRRVSVRKYRPEQIPEDALQAIVRAGRCAPVASGAYDSLQITVVQSAQLLAEIARAVNDMLFRMFGKRMDKDFGAPTLILLSSKLVVPAGMEYANVACVLENMILAAQGRGIDSILWAGAAAAVARSAPLRAKVGISEGFTPVLCASFGYAAVNERAHNKNPTQIYICVGFLWRALRSSNP